MKFTLEDLIPEQASFTLEKTGDFEHILRPLSIEDFQWLVRTFGEKWNDMFVHIDMEKLCRLAYRFLDDRTQFLAENSVVVDEDGEKEEVRLKGYQVLQRSVRGVSDEVKLLSALTNAIGVSQPVMDKAMKDPEVKKKIAKLNSTGAKSLTKSRKTTGKRSKK